MTRDELLSKVDEFIQPYLHDNFVINSTPIDNVEDVEQTPNETMMMAQHSKLLSIV